jgi:hypothetical protein
MFRNLYKLSIIPISLYTYKTIKEINLNKCRFCAFICVTDKHNCLYCIKDILTRN